MSASSNSTGDVKQAMETFEELCTHVEHALGIEIPTYLKNILLHSGFDNRVSLCSFREGEIYYLNEFGQSETYHHVAKGGRWCNFYSIYAPQFNYQNFTIPLGHKKLLINIVTYLQDTRKPVKIPRK